MESLPGWWFGTCFFSIQLGIIIPTDELIFFRGVQTTNQLHMFLFVFLNEFRRLDGILVDLRHHCL